MLKCTEFFLCIYFFGHRLKVLTEQEFSYFKFAKDGQAEVCPSMPFEAFKAHVGCIATN